jgi:succinoglycan biosynthesis protein ExoM
VEWLGQLLKMQASTSADVVGGPVQFVFAATPEKSVIHSRAFRMKTRPGGKTPMLWASNNVLVVAHSLAKVGWPLFDNDFGLTGGEDLEWFRRVAGLRLSFAWAPEALVTEKVTAERATEQWILQRAYGNGNSNMRIAIKHWPSRRLLYLLGRFGLTVGTAPILAPLLLVPRRRLWLLRAWWAAAGAAAALLGRDFHEYAERHAADS